MTNVRQDGLWIDNTILDLFKEALAFGLVYGPEIPTHQWDEMRDTKAKQLTERAAIAALATRGPIGAVEPKADVSDERAEFETWIKKDSGDLSTFGSGRNMHYRNSAVNNAWTGWQARAILALSRTPGEAK